MKYNQPYGVVDPEAVYVNGDPSIGRQGSIPPAESIEYDQREIVNVIKFAHDHNLIDNDGAACAAPTNTDLEQLRKAIFGMIGEGVVLKPAAGDQSYYIDAGLGSDSLGDGSIALPWRTLNYARNWVRTHVELNGHVVTFNAAGAFTEGLLAIGPLPGSGGPLTELWIFASGSSVTDAFAAIAGTYGSRFKVSALGSGVTFSGNAGIIATTGTTIWAGANLKFLNCLAYALGGDPAGGSNGGFIQMQNNFSIQGNATCAIQANGCEVVINGLTVTFISTPTYSSTFIAFALGLISAVGNTFVGSAVGARYSISGNSVIGTNGGGASYIPGSTPGGVASGGEYY